MKSLLLSLLCLPLLAGAAPQLVQIGEEFERPIWLTSPPHSAEKLYIVEQAGRVFIYDQKTEKTLPEPFLDIEEQVSRKGNEEGLLGLAFAPDYATSGQVYANFSNHDQTSEIVRFTVQNPATDLTCDPATKEIILTYKQPFRNHNGGYLEFGPDGYLYIGTGDGGSGNDPKNNGQNLNNLLGKILRIDVSPAEGYAIPADNPFAKSGGKPEILAYGLRNPWRCCWDGDLFYIADVGQNKWEEVNVTTSEQLNGANFGWRLREAFIETPIKKRKPKKGQKIPTISDVGGSKPKDAIDPVEVYFHGLKENEGLSINGGYVYRGSVKSLQGQYLYSDHINPRIWSFEFKDGKATNQRDLTETLTRPDGKKFAQLASFGQDADKELYLIEMGGGAVWKIVEE